MCTGVHAGVCSAARYSEAARFPPVDPPTPEPTVVTRGRHSSSATKSSESTLASVSHCSAANAASWRLVVQPFRLARRSIVCVIHARAFIVVFFPLAPIGLRGLRVDCCMRRAFATFPRSWRILNSPESNCSPTVGGPNLSVLGLSELAHLCSASVEPSRCLPGGFTCRLFEVVVHPSLRIQ